MTNRPLVGKLPQRPGQRLSQDTNAHAGIRNANTHDASRAASADTRGRSANS